MKILKDENEREMNLEKCKYGGHRKKLCKEANCEVCLEKSFASTEWSLYFLEEKNGCKARDVSKGNHKKIWVKCPECKHEFQSVASSLSGKDASKEGCPFCATGPPCDAEKECKWCFEKSMASLLLADNTIVWSQKNQKRACEVRRSTDNKCFFDCKKCNHTYEMTGSNKSRDKGCPFCSGVAPLCNAEKECIWCFKKSMAFFLLTDNTVLWSEKNKKRACEVRRGSNVKCFFDCKKCNHTYGMRGGHKSKGQGCSCTLNKTETKLYNHLLETYPDFTIQKQPKFDWCKNLKTGRFLPFDFLLINKAIPSIKILIELDGDHHFRQISVWKSDLEIQQARDIYKQDLATSQGYKVIRLYQPEVWGDTCDWRLALNESILEAQTNLEPVIICSKLELYDHM